MSNERKHGLGRGMSSLLKDFDFDAQVENVINKTTHDPVAPPRTAKEDSDGIRAVAVPIDSVSANPNQPRKTFDESSIEELAASIKEHGIIQPLLVEEFAPGRYSIVAGERRYRAAKIAGLETVPVIIRSLSEIQRLELSLIENIQRSNLNAIEEATAYQYLIQRSGYTQEELASKLGKSRSAIANSLRLLSLSDSIKDDVISGLITPGHARAILSLVNPSDQILLRQKIVEGDLSVREAEKLAEEYNKGHKIVNKKKKIETEDPEVVSVLNKFGAALGSRVEIKGSLNKGKLMIKFRSHSALERIYSLLSKGDELFIE